MTSSSKPRSIEQLPLRSPVPALQSDWLPAEQRSGASEHTLHSLRMHSSHNSHGQSSSSSHYPNMSHQQHDSHHGHSHSTGSNAQGNGAPGAGNASSPMQQHLTYLQCPLCLDDFSTTNAKLQPRLLPSCAHSLCTRCLHQQWSLQASELLHPTFLCPIDAHPVRVTQVEDIPINRVLIGLMNMMSSSAESEAAFRIGAYARHRCVEEDCDQEATWHCITDEADMCETHKQLTHDGLKSNITRNHRLCRIEEKASKKGPAMCVQHHSALLLWCTECRIHACHACATLPAHSSHPQALKLLGHHLSNASLGGLGLQHNSSVGHSASGEPAFFSDQQMALAKNVVEEEKRMKMTMEREAKELVQTLQVIDSNELHTQQSLDTEFDNLIASIESRRAEMHAELTQRSTQARAALDARMLQLSLNHSLTNTVLEESARVMQMNPFQMVEYMDNLVVRHEKALEKYWEYAYESSLVCWFPLRLSKEPILSHLASFGHVGIPAAPTWKLDECRTEVCGVEVVWEGPPQQGGGDGKEEVKLAAFGGGPMSKKHAPTGPNPTAISFYILHMSPLDPFDLSQEHVSFTEIYRGAHTAFRVANLEAQQSYLFRVQAVSLMGEGVWSQKICMTTLHPAQQMHDATNQMHPFQPSHRQHPGGYDQPLPPTSLLQPNSSYTNGGYASIHGQMLSSTAAFDPMQSMVAHLASPKNGTASAAATQRSMAAEGGWQSARSHGASTMASRVGSPTRFSAGTASLNAGMAAAAYGAPPVAPLSPSHTLSHVPSARATWEELWKLSVILREKDVPSLMRFFLPQVPSSFQLLYRSSRDSPTASSFHSHVANQGSALLVIRVKVQGRDYVFGAYSENGFQTTANGQGQWFPSSPNGTWLFSLINAYKRNLKFKLKRGAEKYAQYGGDTRQTCSFGAHGDLSLLSTLSAPVHRFFPSSLTASSSSSASYEFDAESDARSGLPRFSLPAGSGNGFQATMLCGGETFQCKEVECYAVKNE